MNLLHLRYFHEVARTRSFTESARNLRVSQPAISKMVRQLEGELGHELLARSRKGLRLTPEGVKVFEGAARLFSEERKIEEALLRQDELVGDWTVGISDNLAMYLAPRSLGRFKMKHPKLRIGVFSGTSRQIKDELREERCALGIFFTPLKASEPYEAKTIFETEFWIVVSPKCARVKQFTLSALKEGKVPRIESRHSDYSGGFPAHFHSRKLGFDQQPWIEANQHEIKKRLVLEGFGFALLTRHTVEEEVARGKLIRVKTPEPLAAPIFAAWKKGRELDRASRIFLEEFFIPDARPPHRG